MPARWIKDESIWAIAKKKAQSQGYSGDSLYAVTTEIYKKMGGRIQGRMEKSMKSQKDIIKKFFIDNPNPKDKQVHALAEKLNIDPDDIEEKIYSVLTDVMNSGDKVKGGLADKKTNKKYDKKQIKMGIKVEMEHTDDPIIAREIAMDHLTEDPIYYTKLMKMEGKLHKSYRYIMNGFDELLKAKKAQVGETRHRKGGLYKKTGPNKWIQVKKGPSKKPIRKKGGIKEGIAIGAKVGETIAEPTPLKVVQTGLSTISPDKAKQIQDENNSDVFSPGRFINFGNAPQYMPVNERKKLFARDMKVGDIGFKIHNLERKKPPKNINKIDKLRNEWKANNNKKINQLKKEKSEVVKKGRELKKKYVGIKVKKDSKKIDKENQNPYGMPKYEHRENIRHARD
jgi:hypothetical protein